MRQDTTLFADFDGVHAAALSSGYGDQHANFDPRILTYQTTARSMPHMERTPSDNINYHPAPAPLNAPNVPAVSNEVHVARSAIPIVISLYLVLFTIGMQHPLRLENVEATLRERVVDKKRRYTDVVKVKIWGNSRSKSRTREDAAVAAAIEQSRAWDCERLERAKSETKGLLSRVKILFGKFRSRERRYS
ncbi:hypothetical protein N7G274_002836 [Stereocaulon virgatum]|uniref:Uncharacterized protein n=1 Tax=Stereocaulon virgatum TaxID=373712 RepID=A0ABR4AJS4_9LECA